MLFIRSKFGKRKNELEKRRNSFNVHFHYSFFVIILWSFLATAEAQKFKFSIHSLKKSNLVSKERCHVGEHFETKIKWNCISKYHCSTAVCTHLACLCPQPHLYIKSNIFLLRHVNATVHMINLFRILYLLIYNYG